MWLLCDRLLMGLLPVLLPHEGRRQSSRWMRAKSNGPWLPTGFMFFCGTDCMVQFQSRLRNILSLRSDITVATFLFEVDPMHLENPETMWRWTTSIWHTVEYELLSQCRPDWRDISDFELGIWSLDSSCWKQSYTDQGRAEAEQKQCKALRTNAMWTNSYNVRQNTNQCKGINKNVRHGSAAQCEAMQFNAVQLNVMQPKPVSARQSWGRWSRRGASGYGSVRFTGRWICTPPRWQWIVSVRAPAKIFERWL